MSDIGKFRRARLIGTGYQVLNDTGHWLNVTRATHISAPLPVTILSLDGHPDADFASDDQVFSRTPTEARRKQDVPAR